MKVEIVNAEQWHIEKIAGRMRRADKSELAALGYNPELAIKISLLSATEAWTGLINGDPVCMFGVSPTSALTPHKGRAWMMGTESLDRHSVLFLRRCERQVERMHQHYPLLENWIATDNVVAVKWLEWLGFDLHFDEAKTIGGAEFIKFTRETTMGKDLEKKELFKAGIEVAEDILTSVPAEEQLHIEPEHRFAEGLYARTLTMPKDTVWSSRVHKHENFSFIMEGSCIVVSEEGSREYHAPFVMKTEAGTKRLLRILEDCTWITVHAMPDDFGEDIQQVEDFLAVDTIVEYEHLIEEQKKLEEANES